MSCGLVEGNTGLAETHKAEQEIGSENPLTGSKHPESGRWTKREDKLLKKAVKKYKELGFDRISQEIEGRTKSECKRRYAALKELKKLAKEWTPAEVEVVRNWVEENEEIDVKKLKQLLPNKGSKTILEKIIQLKNQPKRKKAVIRNQKKEKIEQKATKEEKKQRSSKGK